MPYKKKKNVSCNDKDEENKIILIHKDTKYNRDIRIKKHWYKKQTLNDSSWVTNLCVSQQFALSFKTSVPEKKHFPKVCLRPPLALLRHGAVVLGGGENIYSCSGFVLCSIVHKSWNYSICIVI